MLIWLNNPATVLPLDAQGALFTVYVPCRDQDHPQEKEMQKAKWLSEEALQIAEKRREVKGKGERKDIPI